MLVLEYPAKLMIVIAVVVILIGILWQFRERIVKICLFPPCEKEEVCYGKTSFVNEMEINEGILEKYCKLCWERNGEGECKEDTLCYVLNLSLSSVPSNFPVDLNYCSIECSRNVTTLFFEYKWIEKKVKIKC